ncbi:uroporphyrinogen decarboxylase [Legionella quinlivanii]|uniref:Uroporphyrinogen decarboxylase n=1 Tax=Legionella quinlivanii TaxID=45073 RepID=A0A364LNQ2_9GAMM|nr:uroporphyrinogen decarboxylase [Legionella quinlivanii]
MGVNESIFLRSLRREAVPRTPAWLMRQAGRYLPEYRRVRAQAGDFMTLCKTPELACEVTLQPLRRFPLDAAILFSDILTIPDAMGLGLHFVEGEGPCFRFPLHTENAIKALPFEQLNEGLSYVFNAVELIRREMPADLPLIGFSGSPWTLACYMVEGQSSRQFPRCMQLIEKEPQIARLLLTKLTHAVTHYLLAQIHSGVNAVMLFDTWGGLLSTEKYLNFSLNPMREIVQNIKKQYPHIPVILFTKGGAQWLLQMAETGCDALGLDWTADLGEARALLEDRLSLQGNFEPALLLSDEETITKEVERILASYGNGHGHIFNLGHGITPDVPPEHVSMLLQAVQTFSPAYHKESK